MSKTSRYRLLVVIVVTCSLAIASATGLLRFLADGFTRAVSAAAAPIHALGVSTRAAAASAGQDASRTEMEAVIRELQTQNAELKALADENAALKAELGYRDRASSGGITARVVAADDTAVALIVDRGADDGVKVGQPVTVGNGIIIGKIGSLGPKTSRVLLLADGSSALAVTVQASTDTLGVLEGNRGLSTVLTMIPPDVRLLPGQTVITSGLEPGIRRGLIVGVIDKVTKNENDPFQTAAVTPFYASEKILYVNIRSDGSLTP